MSTSTASSSPPLQSSIFSFIFGIIHTWICIPLICKQFNGLIGKSKERLVIIFPLVNARCFFGGLKDIPSVNNNDIVELIVHRPIMFCWRM
uniref:Photosystem I assembly protein Ycf4 n=1 Tax=Panagrolaimus sp. ES5 TaxID=591445 RepID=A0AC34F959_9BILA